MRPGITGLWQVEARDNPSFSAYRRLDLFYVDNWSVTLDIVIMLATVEQVAAKAVRTVLRKRPSGVERHDGRPRRRGGHRSGQSRRLIGAVDRQVTSTPSGALLR